MSNDEIDFGPICDNSGFVHPDEESFCAAQKNDTTLTANNICKDSNSDDCEIPCCKNSCSDVIAPVVVL